MTITQKIEKTLKDAGVDYKFIPLPENLPPDVPSHAAFHHIKLDQAMTTILYKTEKGIIAVVKRADTKVNEANVKKVAGVTQLAFAKKVDLNTLGVESGMVPYLALPVPFYVDEKVLDIGLAYGTGGNKLIGMAMDARDMVRINGGKVGNFADFEKRIDLTSRKYRIVSGITPSGDGSLHIGNYLGAVKQFIEMAKANDCFLFVADLHALTTIQKKEQLQKNIETLILNELALLLGELGKSGELGEMENVTFFRQSDVPMHTELQSILNNVTPLGLLKRAHAYKDKLQKDVMEDDINVGLFSYPMLMAADILLYKPDLVPVGKDQKQHVEITRDIAERFNRIFPVGIGVRPSGTSRPDPVLKLPEAYIPEEVAVIMGTDGKRKMSKSLGNIISIFDDEENIKKQVMSSYTDPTRKHATDPGHVEGNMVFTYLDFFGDSKKVDELKQIYREGKVADVEVKNYLYKSLLKYFAPARKIYQQLKGNPKMVQEILEKGAEKAGSIASQTMEEVREAIGLTNQYSFFDYENFALSKTNTITVGEFAKVEMRVGKVVKAENKSGSDRLIRLTVDFGLKDGGDKGEHEIRTIFTGVKQFGYTSEDFLGKQFLFVTNLAPRKMMNEESQGMILAVDSSDGKPVFIPAEWMPVGARVR